MSAGVASIRSWLILSTVLLYIATFPAEGVCSKKAKVTFSADSTSTIRNMESWTKIYSGNVVIKHSDTILRSSRATYFERDQKIELSEGVTVQDSSRTITSDVAYYFIKTKRALLKGNVRVRSEDKGIDASWIDYSKETGDIVAVGNVKLLDFSEEIVATGRRALYKEEDQIGELSTSPKLVRQDESDSTQMEMSSRDMKIRMKSKEVHAVGNVEITRGSWKAYCDSAVYFYGEGRFLLKGEPRMVQSPESPTDESGNLKGDFMEIRLEANRISELRAEGNAEGTSVSTSEKEEAISKVSGNSVLIKFRDEEVEEMLVGGNATSTYMIQNPEEEPRFNWASSDSIRFFIASGKINRVILKGGVVGTYRPRSGSRKEKASGG